MFEEFLLGCFIGLIFLLCGKLLNFLIEKHLKIVSSDALLSNSDFLSIFKEAIITSILFGSLYLLNSLFHSFFSLIILLSILLSYGFIIKPYVYSITTKNRDFELETKLKNDFNLNVKIFIHDIHFKNALTFGALPFSNIVVISQSLYQDFDKKIIYAIILHEIGHIKGFHMLFVFIYNLIMTLLFNYLLSFLLINSLNSWFFVILIMSCIIYGLIWYFLPVPLMRLFEFKADVFSSNFIGSDSYINVLKQMDSKTNGALSKNDFYHPPLYKRIENVNKRSTKNL